MSTMLWYLAIGSILVAAGAVRLLLARDRVLRLIAMNVVGAGTLVMLVALASRSDPIDPVLSALVITGLVITVAFTGIGAVLVRRLEDPALEDLETLSAEEPPADTSRSAADAGGGA